jgi:hypothetical protein
MPIWEYVKRKLTGYFPSPDYGLKALLCGSSRSACSRAASSGGNTFVGKSLASYTRRMSIKVESSFRVKNLMQTHIVAIATPQTAEDNRR